MNFLKYENTVHYKLSDLKDVDLLKLVLKLFDNERYEEVKKLTDKININTKDQYWIDYLRGYSHLKLSEYDDAIVYFRKALETIPNSAVCYLQIGISFHNKKDFKNAETNYNHAISLKTGYVEAIANLGKLYKDFNFLAKAKNYFNKALKLKENYLK